MWCIKFMAIHCNICIIKTLNKSIYAFKKLKKIKNTSGSDMFIYCNTKVK